MRERWFKQVDVFGSSPYLGNPVAVVLEGQDISEQAMAQFARWTNLSETTFLMPPTIAGADYRVRIFTPNGEIPFAGHPTLGSCHAWLEAGNRPRTPGTVLQECEIGIVTLHANAGLAAFEAPPLRRSGQLDDATLAQAVTALGLRVDQVQDHAWVDNGPGWLGLLLRDAETVLDLKPDNAALGSLRVGVIGPYEDTSEADFEVRAFVPALGIAEDPVTGSLNAGLAIWLIGAGLAPDRYVVSQGAAVGRKGRVRIFQRDGGIWVGGESVTCIDGSVRL